MKPEFISLFLRGKYGKKWIGNFNINPSTGDLYYHQSQKTSLGSGTYNPKYGFKQKDGRKMEADHFSFHSNGRLHQTQKKSSKWEKHKLIQTATERLPIKETGQQLL